MADDQAEPVPTRATGAISPRTRLESLAKESGANAHDFGEALLNMDNHTTLQSIAAKLQQEVHKRGNDSFDTKQFVERATESGFSFKGGLLVQTLPGVAMPQQALSPVWDAAIAMINGNATQADIKSVEQNTIHQLRNAQGGNPSSARDDQFGAIKADGKLSAGEFKKFDDLLKLSGISPASLGITGAVDTVNEVGAVVAAKILQDHQKGGRQ